MMKKIIVIVFALCGISAFAQNFGPWFPTNSGMLKVYALSKIARVHGEVSGATVAQQTLVDGDINSVEEAREILDTLAIPFMIRDPHLREAITWSLQLRDTRGYALFLGYNTFRPEFNGKGWVTPEGAFNAGQLELSWHVPVNVSNDTESAQVVDINGNVLKTLDIVEYEGDKKFVLMPKHLKRSYPTGIVQFKTESKYYDYSVASGSAMQKQGIYFNPDVPKLEIQGVFDLGEIEWGLLLGGGGLNSAIEVVTFETINPHLPLELDLKDNLDDIKSITLLFDVGKEKEPQILFKRYEGAGQPVTWLQSDLERLGRYYLVFEYFPSQKG